MNVLRKTLNTSQIIVEGHTDSLGSEVANKEFSESRASAVAKYLASNGLDMVKIKSEGFGFSKPIADNKSKDGRAQRHSLIGTGKVTAPFEGCFYESKNHINGQCRNG